MDHVDIHVAFVAASAVSVGLVVSYLRLVSGTRFALARAGLAQLVFLVLFSYAFFFEGYTGLTVTIGAIVTLFVLMQVTARVDWTAVFAQRDAIGRRDARRHHHGRQRPVGRGARAATPRRARAGGAALRAVVEARPRSASTCSRCMRSRRTTGSGHAPEVSGLMALFDRYLVAKARRLERAGVRLTVIGRRDRLSRRLAEQIEITERMTACGRRLHLRLAIDYSAREALRRAASAACSDGLVGGRVRAAAAQRQGRRRRHT